MLRIPVIDSHTAAEPTRVIPVGAIELHGATMAERRNDFRDRLDHLRTAILTEPRGSDVWVGAVLTPPVHEGSAAGVVFCNNAGYLGMCGHGTIGVVETLRHLGLAQAGDIRIDTPVGTVSAHLTEDGDVALQNVPARRLARGIELDVPCVGRLVGDISWGGNWFFIVREPHFDIDLSKAMELTQVTLAIRDHLAAHGTTGADGAEIDHVELEGPASLEGADSRNFVLCPGGAYDRSPCGTGTSAKLACLFDDGLLEEGHWYVQESTTGTAFRGKIDVDDGLLIPTIVGRAYVTAESTLLFSEDDPLRWGLG
ncbi:MAG TPA: proline racemase family protein [Fimbriimonas sp.]|nr:proline racemase family protein [Fimbriimonas sp.]